MRFFLIDRITQWMPGESATALKNVSLSEDFFDDHFPRRPVMPGVLIVEGLAQLSGLLLEVSLQERCGKDAKAVMSVLERTRFLRLVYPGETLTYRCRIKSLNELGGKVEAEALSGEAVVATTGIVFGFKEVSDARLDQKRRELLSTWMA